MAAVLVAVAIVKRHEVLRFAVSEAIALATGYQVTFSDQHLGFSHGAFEHIRVSRGGDPVLSAARIDLWYSLRDLLPGSTHRYGLTAIAIDAPRLTILRHRDGSYNISVPSAVPPPAIAAPAPQPVDRVPFRLSVRVRDLRGDVRAAVPAERNALPIRITGVDLDASIDTAARTHYTLSGRFPGASPQPFSAAGTIDVARGYAMHRLRATGLPLAAIANFAIDSGVAKILSGNARNLNLLAYALDVEPGAPLQYHFGGSVDISDARLQLIGLQQPVEDIHGRLQLADDTLFIARMGATLAGIPLRGTGGLFDFSNLHYRFGVWGRGDLAQLRKALAFARTQPIAGIADLGMLIEGADAGPLLVIDMDAAHAGYADIALNDVHARAAYYRNIVTIAPLHAHADGVTFAVGGTLALGDRVKSELVLHAQAPADRLPYAGELLGSEPVVLDAIGDGEDTRFHVRATAASVRGVKRFAALAAMEPDGEVRVAPLWMHTERGDLDAGYSLNRHTDESWFWATARRLHLSVPSHLPFTGTTLTALPAIAAHIDEAELAGGGSGGSLQTILAGRVRAHSMMIASVPIDRLDASFAGRMSGAAIDQVSAAGPWGAIDGSGAFSNAGLVVRGAYRGTLDGLHPFLGNIDAHGGVQGTVALAILPRGIIVQGQRLTFANGSIHDIAIGSASGTLAIENGALHVYSAHAQVAGGDLVAAGAYANGKPADRQLQLVGQRLDAAHLRGIGLPLQSGSVTFDGRLAPGATIPAFNGGVTIVRGRIAQYDIDGSGIVALDRGSAKLSHVVGDMNGAYALVNGTIAELSSGAPAYALRADVPAANLATTLHTLRIPSMQSTGTFNADLEIGGRGLLPSVSGAIGVPAGSVNGLPFIDASASIAADPGGVLARHGRVLVGTTAAHFAGVMRPQRSGLYVNAPVADLSDFNNFFDTGDTLDGDGTVRLDVFSSLNRITSNGNVDITKFRYRNLPIGDTRAIWKSARNTVTGSLSVGGDEGKLQANGSIALVPSSQWQSVLADSSYDLNGSLQNLDLSLWVAAMGFQSLPISGRAGGTAEVRGRYPELALRGDLQLQNGLVGPLPIQSAQIGLRSIGSRIAIDHAALVAPGITATASGSFGLLPTDALALDIHASSADIPRFAATFTRVPVDVSGTFETTVHVGGSFRLPTFQAAFDAQNVDLYGIAIASLFGSLKLHGTSIDLSNAGLTFAHGQATLAGVVPLELNPLRIGPANSPVNFSLDVSDLDPSIFDRVLQNDTLLGGSIDGVLGIDGSVAEPRVSGRFGITGGSYTSSLERTPITAANATLTFDRTRATIDDLRAKLGTGSISGRGSVAFANGFESGHGATFDIDAVAKSAQLDDPAYGSGTLDANLSLKRAADQRAVFSGSATLSNATIPFTTFTAALEKPPGSGGPPFDLGLDFDLVAGKNVRVRGGGFGAGLDIGASGSVKLAGTLAKPTFAGLFTSTGGTLTYFDRAFKVQSGEVRLTAGSLPVLHAVAEAHVPNPDPDLARNPFGTADVTIKVDGQIDALKVAFNSQPPGYSNDQILALIAPFGGFINGNQFGTVGAAPIPGSLATAPLGIVGPLPGTGTFQNNAAPTFGKEAFNILNAQFSAGLLGPFENAISQGLGFSDVNFTVDYYGNVGFTARRFLGRTVSFVYATTFGLPTQTSFGLAISPNPVTSVQLSFFFQNGPTKLFQTPTGAVSTNSALTIGETLQGESGFSFTFQRLYW